MGKDLRALVVQTAQSYLGCKEADGSHRKIIDLYNSQKPLPRGYRVKYTDAWCAVFVSAVAIRCGLTKQMPTECGCDKMLSAYKKLGHWQEKDGYVPTHGDVLFYDWDDSGKGDNTGSTDHVGIVEWVRGNRICVIEGNLENSVSRRELQVDGRYIRGFGLPDYGEEDGRIDTVAEVQKWVNTTFGEALEVDGLYGNLTRKALTRALQKTIGVAADGIYGPKTAAKVKNLQKGSKGTAVRILQGLLVCNGYKGAYVDGDFGSGTRNALMDYQKKKGLQADGIAGRETFKKLCT